MTDSDIRPDLPLDRVDGVISRYREDDWQFRGTPADYRVVHHLERYWFARDYLKKEYSDASRSPSVLQDPHPTLLDAGCGTALGLRELYKSSLPVRRWEGVELEPDIAADVQRQCPSVCIHNGNIETFQSPHQSGPFDILICFEVLGFETISSDAHLLAAIDRLCKSQGTLFLSTPNYRSHPKNRHLKRTYDRAAFTELLQTHLSGYEVDLYGQLYPTNRTGPADVGVRRPEHLSAETDFFIAVATAS